MKVAVLVIACALVPSRPAHALKACSGEHGWAPLAGTTLPPHARLVWYTDGASKDARPEVSATLDGKPVKTRVTKLAHALPYVGFVVEIDSDATGTLDVELAGMRARYQVREDAPRPDEVHATVGTFWTDIRFTAIPETYHGIAIDLDTPAVVAHVKLRRDAKAAWEAFDVPVMPDPTYQKQQQMPPYPQDMNRVSIGELGCEHNFALERLAAGVDLEVTVTFADGRTLPVKDLPTHVKL